MSKNIAAEAQNTGKRDFLREIEINVQKKWDDQKLFEHDAPLEDDGVESWLGTFPYPYMNGKLHLGHGFTVMKVDFAAGFQRMKGKRALFPFGFHCTGMPICSAADKISYEIETYGNPPVFPVVDEDEAKESTVKLSSKAEQKQGKAKYQWEILQAIGISPEEISNFSDPIHWLRYFPEKTRQSLELAGCKIDWRRSFITTEINPYYDAFIQWQFRKLKEQNRIMFGKRYTIYSVKDDGPCMDHDRSSGEGVGVSEYTIVKQRVLKPYPECLKSLEDDSRPVYLMPATLRPETMAGQTNCWVDPDGTYGAFSMKDDEIFVCTERSALNMAYQDMTAESRVVEKLAEFKGEELIGTKLNAPLTSYDEIYVLPMFGVSCEKTTGVVTSVPSDSPDDFATFRDLKNKEALREKYGIKDEWIMDFDILPVISIPEYGDCAAVTVVERMKIKSQNDTKRLKEAKDEVYLKGFNFGVMSVGKYNGRPVKEAKELIKQDLLAEGLAYIYCEPESKVVSRSGDTCIVALCDQWYLNYGDPEWKALVKECFDQMEWYTPEIKKQFAIGIDWIAEHACSRSYGLGTHMPWDPEYLIDSLSDSTIYMVYYTIANYLQGNVDGSTPGSAGIAAEDLSDDFFDYLFTGAEYKEGPVPEETMKKIRNEVRYWYPVDLRNSGKDLVRNHLLFYIFNHVSLFSREFWPKSIRYNGHLLLNKNKMSKSTGNFITLEDAVYRYSADGMRFALADSGDQIEDANFMTETADSAILKLWNLIDWIKDTPELFESRGVVREPSNYQEKFFAAEIDNAINLSIGFYEEMKYKDVVKYGFFELCNAKDEYMKIVDMMNEPVNVGLIERYVDAVTRLMAPITSHISEYIWSELMHKEGSVFDAGLPQVSGIENAETMILAREYINSTLKRARKQKISYSVKNEVNKVTVYVFTDIPEWKVEAIELIKSLMTGDEFPPKKLIAQNSGKNPILKKNMKNVMPFVALINKQYNANGASAFDLGLPFDETEIWNLMSTFVAADLGVEQVVVKNASEIPDPKNKIYAKGEPGFPIFSLDE